MPYLKAFVKFQHPETGNYVQYWPGEDPGEDAKYITNPLAWMSEDEVPMVPADAGVPQGAPAAPRTLEDMKIKDLIEYARDRGIEIRSGSNKEALIATIQAAENANAE